MRRIRAVVVKEFFHILRDPASLTIVFLMPVVMVFIFGFSISYDLDRIPTGVIDPCQGEYARTLVKTFAHNGYFEVQNLETGSRDPFRLAEERLRKGDLKAVLILPADFERRLQQGLGTEIGLLIDGSDTNVANLIHQYADMVLLDFLGETGNRRDDLRIGTKIHFNPEAKSTYFFIPGIIAILLLMISALLTSLSIARENESGSIDLIFISPLKSTEIILGKTVPYILVALMDGLLILVFARFIFGVPFRGDLLVLLAFSLLYILTGLSLGILISATATSQRTAMFAALLITLLPSIMLSGFIFPLESLAPVLRWISRIVPATYFLRVIRGVILKGAGFHHFLFEALAMALFSTGLIVASIWRFTRARRRST